MINPLQHCSTSGFRISIVWGLIRVSHEVSGKWCCWCVFEFIVRDSSGKFGTIIPASAIPRKNPAWWLFKKFNLSGEMEPLRASAVGCDKATTGLFFRKGVFRARAAGISVLPRKRAWMSKSSKASLCCNAWIAALKYTGSCCCILPARSWYWRARATSW